MPYTHPTRSQVFSGSSTGIPVTASATVTLGNLVLIAFMGNAAPTLIASVLGNVPVALGTTTYGSLWQMPVTTGGAETITVTSGNNAALSCLEIANWSSIDVASVYGATASSAAANSGATGIPVDPSFMVVGIVEGLTAISARAFTSVTAQVDETVVTMAGGYGIGISEGIGSVAETFTATVVNGYWVASCVIVRGITTTTPQLATGATRTYNLPDVIANLNDDVNMANSPDQTDMSAFTNLVSGFDQANMVDVLMAKAYALPKWGTGQWGLAVWS